MSRIRRTAASMLVVPFLLATAAGPLAAQTPPAPTDGPIERMKPGEYLWAPQIAPYGPVTIIVSLKTQRAYAYRNGLPIGVSTVSTGKPGHATPTGIFTILQKHIDHKSNLYDDAPMPFMQRLTWDGIALHAGKLPGYPASHGCVRLPRAFAELLYSITKLGLTVIITDNPLAPVVAPAPGVLEQPEASAPEIVAGYRWQPELSPAGPLSIVVSGQDRRILVLRNGIEIGSSDIQLDAPITETTAFTLRAVDPGGAHWLRLTLPGQAAGDPVEATPEQAATARLPEAFRQLLISVLEPGTTLLVTRDTLKTSGAGRRLTVIAGDKP